MSETIVCPVCKKGHVIEGARKFCCTNPSCRFTIYRKVGCIPIDQETVIQLSEKGESTWINHRDADGNRNSSRLFLRGRTLLHESRYEYVKGRCPVCGGGIVITSKGYSCINHLEGHCPFHLPGIMANRKVTASEVEDFLRGGNAVLNGFCNEKGVIFSGILRLNGTKNVVYVETIIGKCPLCGGNVRVGPSFYACDNFANNQVKCTFKVYRDIAHHAVTHDEMAEIIANGCTSEKMKFYREDGSAFRSRLGLDANGRAIFI